MEELNSKSNCALTLASYTSWCLFSTRTSFAKPVQKISTDEGETFTEHICIHLNQSLYKQSLVSTADVCFCFYCISIHSGKSERSLGITNTCTQISKIQDTSDCVVRANSSHLKFMRFMQTFPRHQYYVVKVSQSGLLGCYEDVSVPSPPLRAKFRTNLITAGRVQVSPPALNVTTTHPAFKDKVPFKSPCHFPKILD